jgi:RND family efflux transporter MFP subunit
MMQALVLFVLLLALAPPGAGAQELDCLIEPEQSVTLSFAVEGVVEGVLVQRGALVEEGQVLARLQADVERASLEVARARAEAVAAERGSLARLEIAQRILDRNAELQDREVVSEGTLDEVRREHRLAEASLLDAKESRKVARLEAERAAAVLGQRTVRSPLKGVVVERILSPGEWADPPQVLELAQIDPLRVEVFARLEMLDRIEVGQPARVLPESPVGGDYEAKVSMVDRVVDAASGTFRVRLELPNPDYALPAGIKCRVRFAGLESTTSRGGKAPPAPMQSVTQRDNSSPKAETD